MSYDDVKTTYLRLYLPKDRPWYTFNITGGVTTRTVSLLDAALHNFAASETCETGSDFIGKPDERGLFDIKPIKSKMTIAQFQTLCRELDIGALYTEHLDSILLPDDAVAKASLKHKVTESQKAAFKAAAHLALMTKDITRDSQELILAMLDGQRNLTLKGKVVQFAELSIMDAALTGIVLITPDLERSRNAERLIVYVPNDPEHPLNEYASGTDFLNELTRQLRDNAFIESAQMTYRQYFSQFVDQHQRGHFFAGLQQRLFQVQWHQKEALDQRPTWREEPVANPNLQFSVAPITGDFWGHLYQQKLNKILNDAREIVVSTADTDSNARWAWWDNFKKIVSDIFNVALMVVTPFVPGLGELMMAYTAYQITYDLMESIVDLAEGLWVEAAEHFVGVVTDIILLAAFAEGAQIGQMARLKLSPFVDGMKPVVLPDGQTRLWNPDLKPYEQPNLKLPADSSPNELGLHSHEGQDILQLDDKHYAVQKDPKTGNHQIKHPSRPEAYSPELKHNGLGAWTHEAENPRTWEGPTLMQRLGHSVGGLSDAELEQIRTVSGTQENALRKMHVENAPPPPLLTDALKRFKIDQATNGAIQQIRDGLPLDPPCPWLESLAPHMEGWPADKALKVYEAPDKTGSFRQYGKADAPQDHTLSTSLSHVLSGKFPESIVEFLDEEELEALLGKKVPADEQVQALRDRLADEADKHKADIFKQRYQFQEKSTNAHIRLLQRAFPELPCDVAEKLLSSASEAELDRMTQTQRIPLRLKNLAREAAFEARTSHVYEGFYDEAYLVPDTERLALNTLRIYTDTFSDLRIEVRDGTYHGPLRCSVGEAEASTIRLLVRDEFAKYEVRDATNNKLHKADDFYESILNALPGDKRTALGYQIGEGQLFKQWVMAKTEAPVERRTVLAEPPIRPVPDLETVILLRGPGLSKAGVTLEERVRDLYPHMSEREVNAFVQSLNANDEPLAAMKALEGELQELRQKLSAWEGGPYDGASEELDPRWVEFKHKGGRFIADRLMECFERKASVFGERSTQLEAGYTLDLSQDLSLHDLERWWKELPDLKKYLDKVTTLSVDNSSLYRAHRSTDLFKSFPNLRRLSARKCELTGLPEGLDKMHWLAELHLSDNRIRLNATSIEHLKNLTHLEVLKLDNNPLGDVPDISRMPKLRIADLKRTGISSWPKGTFNKPRPGNFLLDLQENPLTQIPQVTPGRPEGLVVARTRLTVESLSDANRLAYEDYRTSAGLRPQRVYSAEVRNDINTWSIADDAGALWDDRADRWADLADEPNSAGFFTLLRRQADSADYLAGGESRKMLSERVWQSIDAASRDTRLRTELFDDATAPATCQDAGAQAFNAVGKKVLTSEAYALSPSPEILENKLVTLAKGAARLDQVNAIAREDMRSRGTDRDEVEVYLAYQIKLAERLNLPWQSKGMLFGRLSHVTDNMIDAAYDKVLDLEKGDGLVNQMIDQTFWNKYLTDTHPGEFAENSRIYQRKAGLIDDLQEAQNKLAHPAGLTAQEKTRLGDTLKTLAAELGIAQIEVFTGAEMSSATYERLYSDMGDNEKELSRRLTRTALESAGQ